MEGDTPKLWYGSKISKGKKVGKSYLPVTLGAWQNIRVYEVLGSKRRHANS